MAKRRRKKRLSNPAEPGRPSVAEVLAKLAESHLPKLKLLDAGPKCGWCERRATTWFKAKMACNLHENLLQQIANEETWETMTRWTGHEVEWWD